MFRACVFTRVCSTSGACASDVEQTSNWTASGESWKAERSLCDPWLSAFHRSWETSDSVAVQRSEADTVKLC